jgi:Flp pilus assembly protein TadG
MRSLTSKQEGAVAVIVAILLVVLMAAVALAVDAGGLYLRRRELVNGADAAALSAARTCARGGSDTRFASIEAAADYGMRNNSPGIKDVEFQPPVDNIDPSMTTTCGGESGHVTVRYTSQQNLYFAPVLGFGTQSPVTTQATASWGLGSNNPIPLAIGGKLLSTCPLPPSSTATKGQTCGTWYDNDDLNNGNFGFLSLYSEGWDVPQSDNCSNAEPGTSQLTRWISAEDPVSITLNFTDPTFVCSSSGFHNGGSAQQGFDALRAIVHQTRDFPIIWEGWSSPVNGAPAQGSVYQSNNIEKYDVIGFASLTIDNVLRATDADAAGQPAADYTCRGSVKNNTTIPASATAYSWFDIAARINGGPCNLPPTLPVDSVISVSLGGLTQPADYTASTSGVTLIKDLTEGKNVSFTLHNDAKVGVCGPAPSDKSAICVLTTWNGSTLTDDYPDEDRDNIRVVRLCDIPLHSCLDDPLR